VLVTAEELEAITGEQDVLAGSQHLLERFSTTLEWVIVKRGEAGMLSAKLYTATSLLCITRHCSGSC
jgi:hypothetical protein